MYDNEYGIDDYAYLNQNKLFNFKIDLKKLVLFIIVFFILIFGIILLNNISFQTPYEKLENRLVEEAKKYVLANNLQSNNEYYIDSRKLNINLDSNCYDVSGVFVNGNNYQAYLYCNDYETNLIDNNSSNIKLYGKDISFLKKGNSYIETSYENLNNVSVNINGHVGTEEGVYKLEYIILKNNTILERLIRKVVVLDNEEINDFYPNIKLNGNEIEYLKINELYIDKGVVVTDKTDGPTNDVKINGEVNINKEGEYLLTYTATNTKGYASSVTRRVIVVSDEVDIIVNSIISPKVLTSENVRIFMGIYGENFDYVVLPNQEMKYEHNLQYEVSENGSYDFVIYDKNGNFKTETILVDNINRVLPEGTCEAKVYSNYTEITVNANSNNGISNYNYVINNKEYGFNISNRYRVNINNINDVKVKVKDTIGNEKTITCNINHMDPTIGNNNVQYYNAFNNEYVIPKTRNNLDQFINRVKGKICQSADVTNCGDACLSFSLYHAYYLQYGNMNEMNLDAACNYRYPIRFDIKYSMSKEEILGIIYNEIFAGRVIVLQVDNNNKGRHFVLVVGYKRNVYSADELREEDLIYIDSWGGNFNSIEKGSRKMFSEAYKGGYRVDKINSEYYSLWP